MLTFNETYISDEEVGIMLGEIIDGVNKEDSSLKMTFYKSRLWDLIVTEMGKLEVGEQLKIIKENNVN